MPITGKAGERAEVRVAARPARHDWEYRLIESAAEKNSRREAAHIAASSAFDAMAAGVVVQDASGAIVHGNAAAARILGYDRAALLALNSHDAHWEAVTPEGRVLDGRDHPAIVALRTGEPVENFVFGVRKADGSTVWLNASAIPFKTERARNPDRVVTTFSDITQRVLAEEALRTDALRITKVLEAAPIGMAVVGIDGRCTRVNAALCRLLGFEEHELVGRDLQTITHADDLEVDAQHMRRLVSGKSLRYQTEKRLTRKNGTQIWAQMSFTVLRDDDGNVTALINQIQGIDGRKRAEAQQRELVARLDLAAGAAELGVWELDLPGEHLTIDERMSSMFALPREAENLSDRFFAGVEAADVPVLRAALERVVSLVEPAIVEFRYTPPGGSRKYFKAGMQPLVDEQGTVVRVIGATVDVTPQAGRRRLAYSSAALRALIDAIAQPVALIALDATVLAANERFAAAFETTLGSVEGRRLIDGLPAHHAERHARFLAAALRGERVEFTEAAGGAASRAGALHGAYVPFREGRDVAGCTLVLDDANARKELEARLLESNEQLVWSIAQIRKLTERPPR
jgi:PAS domain S-box-containing protein